MAEPTREEVDAMTGITVLEFGASWCPICQGARPTIDRVLGEFPAATHVWVEDGKGKRLGRSYAVKLWPIGFERRLAWVVENTQSAVLALLSTAPLELQFRRALQRAALRLQESLAVMPHPRKKQAAADVLDASIRTKRSLDEVARRSSTISKQWNIVTELKGNDFLKALEEADDTRP